MRWFVLLEVSFFLMGLGGLYWQPSYTDGLRWVVADSCRYSLAGKLPFQEARPFEVGDKLLRIDYMPVCSLAMPPPITETTLFLYEIARNGQRDLRFAEFRPYPPLGWFQRPMTLVLSIGLFLSVLAMGLLILRTMFHLRRYVETNARLIISLMWLFLVHCVLMGWVDDTYHREVSDWTGVVVGVMGLGWMLWRVEVGVGIGLLAGVGAWIWPGYAGLIAGVVWGSLGFILAGPIKWVYWGLWLIWGYAYESLWLFALPVLVVGEPLIPFWRIVYKILTLRERYFYLCAFLVAVSLSIGAGSFFSRISLWRFVMGALAGGVAGWVSLEGLYWLYRRRRVQRRGLLERDLPLLWEVPDIGSLEHRVRELLSMYWEVGWAEIVQAAGVQRLWLRRRGEPPPHPDWHKGEIEVAIPLGESYWLLIGQTRAPLTVEDIAWLVHFGRYIGISRRHLALYEAAHEARLQALRHQLSPHFLFNALHTLQGLLYEDVALAEKLLSRLGQLLRRSLELAKHLLIPLSEEIALVQDYLEIEKQRYGERLILRWEVPNPPPEALIPPFTIQTLVENSIKHAVAKQMRPTTIHLRVNHDRKSLLVLIADDGPGFSGEGATSGIGLTNLRTRLEHIYGAGAQLTIQEGKGVGVRVDVTLPLSLPGQGPTLPDRNQSPGATPS